LHRLIAPAFAGAFHYSIAYCIPFLSGSKISYTVEPINPAEAREFILRYVDFPGAP
jgi:hypothetical protein